MAKISLASYSISVKDDNNQSMYMNQEKEGTEKAVFLGNIKSFITKYTEKYSNDESIEKLFKFDFLDDYTTSGVYHEGEYKDGNGAVLFKYIICRMKTGEYGYSSEIVDSEEKEDTYKKKANQAEVLPFYILIATPTGEAEDGIAVFQNISNFGVKTIFQRYLNYYMKDEINKSCRIEMGNLAPYSYIEKYIKHGLLKELTFVRNKLPVDRANALGVRNGLNNEQRYDLYTVKNPGPILSEIDGNESKFTELGRRVMRNIRGENNLSDVVAFDDFDYDNMKMVFNYEGSTKTINLDNLDNLRVTDDITKKVFLEDGHPTYDSIKNELINTAKYYLKESGRIEELDDN